MTPPAKHYDRILTEQENNTKELIMSNTQSILSDREKTHAESFWILHVDHNIYVVHRKVRYRITDGEWEAYLVNADDHCRAKPVESQYLKRQLSEALENHIRKVTREGNIAARAVAAMTATMDRVRDGLPPQNIVLSDALQNLPGRNASDREAK